MSKKIENTSNTQQAFWVALASLVTFSFGIFSAVILSRYLSKFDYGTYKQVLFIYSTLLVVFTLGLPKAYSFFLPRVEINQARHAIKKITNIFFILGGMFSLLLYCSAGSIAELLRNEQLELAIKIFSPVPLFMLPTMGIEGIFSCYRQTHLSAIYTLCTRVFMLLCMVLPIIIFNTTYIGALIGFTTASFFTFLTALYLKYLPVKSSGHEKSDLTYNKIFSFSIPLMIASIWGIIEISSSQFLISRYFGTEKFAEYSNGAMELPLVGMVLGATSAVLSPIFSRMAHQKVDLKIELYPLWIRVFEKSAMLTYPFLAFCIIFAQEIMIALYGVDYANSAIYFQIFNIYYFFTIIVYGPYLINTGREKIYANAHMYSVLILIPLQLLFLNIFNNPISLVVIVLLIKTFRTLFFLNIISNDFKCSIFQLLPIVTMSKIIVSSILISLSSKYILINIFNISGLYLLFLGGIIYLLIYSFYAYLFKIDYISILKPLLSKKLKL
ncbi:MULTISPECIES: oligosaccharide flippase family protein [unclassified Acinetobacter]|uniref:oligosaccharide flippase family protein n=1 Tax=unclassified Acinetobacter TaxID=196816 RepID=UPI0015D30304|nr:MULTISPECIES: oligosaccharide flippase family protein [unclassified Acinetobacter]